MTTEPPPPSVNVRNVVVVRRKGVVAARRGVVRVHN